MLVFKYRGEIATEIPECKQQFPVLRFVGKNKTPTSEQKGEVWNWRRYDDKIASPMNLEVFHYSGTGMHTTCILPIPHSLPKFYPRIRVGFVRKFRRGNFYQECGPKSKS